MKYSRLVEIYEKVAATPKRLEKTQILADFLRQVKLEDKNILYLLQGIFYPRYKEDKLGISNQLVIKILAQATKKESKHIVSLWRSIGDLGEVALQVAKEKKQSTLYRQDLTTEKIFESIHKLPAIEGKGAVEKKLALISELFSQASPTESKYLIRTLIGDLRIGIQDSTIRDAIAQAFFPEDKKEAVEKIAAAIEKSNDLALVFEKAKTGLGALDQVSLEVGKAVKVMLAQKVKNISEGFNIVGKPAALEYKYDGFRLLINKGNDKISMFTRRLENVTKQFPEVAHYVSKYVNAKNFIIDAEAVGYDSKKKKYLPFQSISQRIKRKYNIEKLQKEFPIELNVFDILYYNGSSLLKEPFKKRTELLRKIITPEKWKIVPAKQIITSDEGKADEFYKQALKDNQEGVMMKNLDAEYKPGSRVGTMLKIKPEERDFDLVIVGGEYGTGKRAGWISSFILACKHKGEFLEIGRVGTGIKEKEEQGVSFIELTNMVKPYIHKEEGRLVSIKPKIIVSVTYQEIQNSPTYSSGFALRFPRFTALRPDKGLDDIATLDEIKREYNKQRR